VSGLWRKPASFSWERASADSRSEIVRMENGLLAEHWDVIENEATRESSKSGLPMFGDSFPE
jgi:predicted SnoaL-like aldol condensation-catalyzing enzyme